MQTFQTIQTIQTNEMIIHETSSQMEDIAKDVETIRDIYKDLSMLVQNQGEQLNTISDNIEHTVHHTESAVTELKKAEKRQNKCIVL